MRVLESASPSWIGLSLVNTVLTLLGIRALHAVVARGDIAYRLGDAVSWRSFLGIARDAFIGGRSS